MKKKIRNTRAAAKIPRGWELVPLGEFVLSSHKFWNRDKHDWEKFGYRSPIPTQELGNWMPYGWYIRPKKK